MTTTLQSKRFFREYKPGELVKVPECSFTDRPSYIGTVIAADGYKIEVMGGENLGVVSWDGKKGVSTWHTNDLRPIEP